MPPPGSSPRLHRVAAAPGPNIFLYLIAFRLINALVVRTFFQPDEFFQSLEPAWQIAFGKDQGAWLTWEWRHQLRSSLHPLLFAAVYKLSDCLAILLSLSPTTRANLLITGPKALQAVVAATGDFYTWKLASRIYGADSRGAWATLIATVLNPWQWFCSTRTFSNSLETSLTVVALEFWPWKWSAGSNDRKNSSEKAPAEARTILFGLRQCLCLAALACILRPTNIIIWVTLAGFAWFQCYWDQRKTLAREVLLCGLTILAVSAGADRLFYGFWTFPPLRFLYFNIAQSLAVFYGSNDWHYYLSQGFPLLLTTLVPFAATGLYFTLKTRTSTASDKLQTTIRVQLATICVVMPSILSLISHKEVRFIYPLLPSLHILAAPGLIQKFWPALESSSHVHTPTRLLLIFLILVNVAIATYTSYFHAAGPLNVLTYLRRQHEAHSSVNRLEEIPTSHNSPTPEAGITAGFLMPCHSTPWRSHLVYPSIDAWALSCEPPIDLNKTQKAVYRDEADQFYDNPSQFLRDNMGGGLRHLPRRPSYITESRQVVSDDNLALHEWPDYLIFFAQLEPTMRSLIRGSSYGECWRTWNTPWHDDWRRSGDIVVWCLDSAEQDTWRSDTHRRAQETRERQFERILTSFKNEAARQQKRGWKSVVSSFRSWSLSPSSFSFTSLKRSALSLFSPHSSSHWPWKKRSRLDMFLANFRCGTSWHDWVPSWPEWLGGPTAKKISKREQPDHSQLTSVSPQPQ
ncbi:hypothetical protein N7493_008771 [Penicillium malachiteum]|uniref:Mannosyltransferase n=1 Tax=Penicillium malachiteum TaxID=1324776 RepID=A0AAD6HFC2_9EURO|nr:hypothetical protein N7493_008771 [Penicillium malachiteum]